MLLVLASTIALAPPRIIERVDPITDETSVYALVGDANQHIAIGCSNTSDNSTIRVVVRFKQYIGDATPGILLGGTDVQYRFDKRAVESVRWYSHDREVSAESDRSRPINFMLAMKGSTTAYIRATNYDAEPVDARFDYSIPDSFIDNVLVRCGYNPDGSDPRRPAKKRR